MTPTYSTDILIFGGGIAGLWLLNRFRNEGYQAILLESKSLGGGQTLASQGIIHGGLKYALSGSIGGATQAIADMPERWRQCLAGNGDVDLSSSRILSESYYMWSDSGLRSKLKTFLGSKSLRGRIEAVEAASYPNFFKQATVAGSLYKLPDFVLDTESLIEALVRRQVDHIFKIDSGAVEFVRDAAGSIDAISIAGAGGELTLNTQRTIFCAGEGNQQLIQQAQLKTPSTQTRPLKMLIVKKRGLPPVYLHCIGDSFSLTPKLTVTSHVDSRGEAVWYLGGEIAEAGVAKTDEQQIEAGKRLVAELFPWIDFDLAQWRCLTINRAEANIKNDYRPDDAFFIEEDKVVTAWPTKLTLTPSLADKLVEHFAADSLRPRQHDNSLQLSGQLQPPEIAAAYWD